MPAETLGFDQSWRSACRRNAAMSDRDAGWCTSGVLLQRIRFAARHPRTRHSPSIHARRPARRGARRDRHGPRRSHHSTIPGPSGASGLPRRRVPMSGPADPLPPTSPVLRAPRPNQRRDRPARRPPRTGLGATPLRLAGSRLPQVDRRPAPIAGHRHSSRARCRPVHTQARSSLLCWALR